MDVGARLFRRSRECEHDHGEADVGVVAAEDALAEGAARAARYAEERRAPPRDRGDGERRGDHGRRRAEAALRRVALRDGMEEEDGQRHPEDEAVEVGREAFGEKSRIAEQRAEQHDEEDRRERA